jgi:hypothetical protein
MAKISQTWLDSVLRPRPHVIAPAIFEEDKPRKRARKPTTVHLIMALNDYDKVRRIMLDGQSRLPNGVREELASAIAERWKIEDSAILAVLDRRRRDPRIKVLRKVRERRRWNPRYL